MTNTNSPKGDSVFGNPEKKPDSQGAFNDILSLEDQQKQFFAPEKGGQTNLLNNIRPAIKLTPVKMPAGFNQGVITIDAMDQWRKTSELYRKKKLSQQAREHSTHREKEIPEEKPESGPQQPKRSKFQEIYELESFHFIAPAPFIAEDLKKRLLTADLEVNPELLIEPEPEEYPALEDGTLRVSDVMTKDVICIIESMTIEQAASLFNRRKITGAPVVNYKSRQLVGIISLSDILFHTFETKAISTFHHEGGGSVYQQDSLAILEKPVSAFMSTDVIQVTTDCNVRDACKLMLQNKIHRVIVTKDSQVKGIFTSFDTVRLMAGFDLKVHQDKP
jgi:CBS domain-containing protein